MQLPFLIPYMEGLFIEQKVAVSNIYLNLVVHEWKFGFSSFFVYLYSG